MREVKKKFKALLLRLKDRDWHDGSERLEYILKDTQELIEYNEAGVALENICQNLYEYSVAISKQDYEVLEKMGTEMKMSSTAWDYLTELIEQK